MLLAQSVDLEIFFVLSLIGFLIIVELIAPKYIQPGYLRYIQYILAAGIVIFGVIVAQKVMEILANVKFLLHQDWLLYRHMLCWECSFTFAAALPPCMSSE